MSLWNELKRRNVLRVTAAYVVVGWLILQVADIVFGFIGVPDWVGQLLIALLVLGFVPVIVVAWIFELTPEGIRREKDLPADHQNHVSARKLDYVTIGAVVVLAILTSYQLVLTPGEAPTADGPASVAEQENDSDPFSSLPAESASDAPPNSIAVLPFANMSADPENEYFSDGVSEEILNQLARIPELKVAARTSAFQFKGDNRDIGEIGRLLNVNHVLEGSVRRAGDRVRVTAQLINVADGFHMWSDNFDRKIDDIFAIQDEIASAIAQAMEVALIGTKSAGDTNNVEAYNLFLQGRALLAKRDTAEAIAKFQQAIDIDPGFGRAYSNIAFAQVMGAFYTGQTRLEDTVNPLIDQALSIDPKDALALTARAQVHHQAHRFDEAKRAFEDALEADPDSPDTLHLYAILTALLGDPERALSISLQARSLDPLSPIINDWVARHLANLGRLEEALQVAQDNRRLAPDFGQSIELAADLLLALGRKEEALAAYRSAIGSYEAAESGGRTYPINANAARIRMFAAMGKRDEVLALMQEILATAESGSLKAYAAQGLTRIGQVDSAVEVILANQPVNPGILFMYLRSIPAWQQPELADHPALKNLADSVGLPLNPLEPQDL
ncbi:MAG: tetratricopeptide repeat protein [Xanthomonadales bacterium]|nr:tetratricopeptide repeat protein [Xanthomonadales bacterium]